MSELPEGVAGRRIAVALLAIVLGAVWTGIVAPAAAWYAARAERLERQAPLARRMDQIAADLPDLRRRAAASEASAPVTVLQGATDAVAGAALQQRLQQIAASTGAALASTEVLPGEQLGAYRRIGVRLALAAPWPVVVRLLGAIRGGAPRMLVNDLRVQSTRAVLRDADPPLTATMVVFGFRAGQAA